MPKRYTFYGLQETVKHAGDVMDFTKKANSVFFNDFTQYEDRLRRIGYWKQARESLQALSTRINVLVALESSLIEHNKEVAKKNKNKENNKKKKENVEISENLEEVKEVENDTSENVDNKANTDNQTVNEAENKDESNKEIKYNKIRGLSPKQLNNIEDLIINEQTLLTKTINRELNSARKNIPNWSEIEHRVFND